MPLDIDLTVPDEEEHTEELQDEVGSVNVVVFDERLLERMESPKADELQRQKPAHRVASSATDGLRGHRCRNVQQDPNRDSNCLEREERDNVVFSILEQHGTQIRNEESAGETTRQLAFG